MAAFDRADIERLLDGNLAWAAVQEMMREAKDRDRFDIFVDVLQSRVPWDDPILLPLTPQLFIVDKPTTEDSSSAGLGSGNGTGKRTGKRVVKCRCGHEFGDHRINWKLSALINVREDEASLAEVYVGREMPDPTWMQLREYICPGCGSQLEVEAVPRGTPPDFDFLPDLDTFYDEWLGRPRPDTVSYEDLTLAEIARWTPAPYSKPLPELKGHAKKFYDFCRKGELRFQRCSDCGTWRHVPREMCAECGSQAWTWERSSGKGTVFSWTVADRALHPEFVDDTPYAPTIVEMEEGVRLLTQIVDVEPDDLEIGMPVEVVFDAVTAKVTLPKFRRAGGRSRVTHAVPIESLELPPTIRYEKSDRVAVITIDRPEAMNSLTKEMLGALDRAVADFNDDPDLWVAILTAAGDRAFCTGMDLKDAIPLLTSGDQLGYEDHTKRQFSDVFKPIIAAINGHCIAGGMEMMAGTDLRVAAEHATFGLGEVRWGLVPAGGSHIRVPRQIPWAVAMELLLTGDPIDAHRAYEVGLVNRVVPAAELMDAAFELAERICRNGPLAVHTSKEIAVRALGLESGFVLEKALAARVFASEDAKEGPRAFAEKRKPDFKGR